MSIDVTVKRTQPMTVAFIVMKGPYSLIDESFGRLFAFVAEQGFLPAGPPSGVYFNSPEQVSGDELQWELRAPIAGVCDPSGPDEKGLGFRQVEDVNVAAAIHRGPVSNIGETIKELESWIAGNGYKIYGPCEEVYLTEPGNTPPAEILTEVRFPVSKE